MAFGCRGNYKGEPYSKMVSSWDEKSKEDWIAAMPNDPESLRDKGKIWLCVLKVSGYLLRGVVNQRIYQQFFQVYQNHV